MSETFKPGRGPSSNPRSGSRSKRPSNGYDIASSSEDSETFFPIETILLIAAIVLFYVYYRWFNSKDGGSKTRRRRVVPPEPFKTVEEVQRAIRKAGMESCNLILGVDFTKSNSWNGTATFGGKCLHDINSSLENPYQRVMRIISGTLEAFDDDHMIPAYGFGDVFTGAKDCFPFFPDRSCIGLTEVLDRYNQIAAGIQMSGPTNFAPVIRKAISIVKETEQYHVLVIIADGQVDRKDETVRAIVEASKYPLSIVCVGVGDGPWDKMIEFDDDLPQREFDNFQFVDFHAIERECYESEQLLEPQFALDALMELPAQYLYLKRQGKI
mmetsp:Transcript_38739/g.60420  ORF Transcript_38739/g.60420 Transcript_38739/m.60420 type:complete len:326 (-) Transcript_38739:1307-2284(-)|eukprot:CAMPEP_0184329578 /NCGR_PEP_ID=MMETSP1049-20130417/144227_1 /TAXON_ID=77928 /ORGANISM="Proteomonas sulcata, Strain CCMP704" /LENGTH=325 /DNA_ID=CAMNT_0026651959 /DNA_START=287 /DNA_END=1264 /DNA_ORIENTATION=-